MKRGSPLQSSLLRYLHRARHHFRGMRGGLSEPQIIPVGPKGIQALTDYLAAGGKPRDRWRVGTECEKLAVDAQSGQRLAYLPNQASAGILNLFESLIADHDWSPVGSDEPIVALEKSGASITLEPGGQFELSGAPFSTIHEANAEFEAHHEELRHLSRQFRLRWLFTGADACSALNDVPWMPKPRYAVMRSYLPTRGNLGLHMMKKTCTIQANLDYADEIDMGRKLRASMGIASVVQALYANSPFERGEVSPYKTVRGHIWTDTDEDRAGLLPWVFEGELPSYEQWVRQALKVPMFAVVRDGVYHPANGLTFGAFMEHGFKGWEATFDDWTFHLSTLFFEVRVKTHLEVRSADCVPPQFQMSLPALYKGVLYHPGALEACLDLTAGWSFEERLAHRIEVTKSALDAPLPRVRYKTLDLARELLSIARTGLIEQALEGQHEDEAQYLLPVENLVASGRSLADASVEWFNATPPAQRDFAAHYSDTLCS
jgi:glutamate--cysteine ligase